MFVKKEGRKESKKGGRNGGRQGGREEGIKGIKEEKEWRPLKQNPK